MGNQAPAKRQSLNRIAVFLVVAIATFIFGAMGMVNVSLQSRVARDSFDASTQFFTKQLATSLALPLWNYDLNQVRLLEAGLLERTEVMAVEVSMASPASERVRVVRDGSGRPVETGVQTSFDPRWNLLTQPVIKDGQILGTATVAFTMSGLEADLARSFWLVFVTILLFDGLLILVLSLAIRKVFLEPIGYLEQFALQVRSEAATRPGSKGIVFWGEIGGLQQSIHRMFELLEDRYMALQKTEIELRESRERFILAVEGSDNGIWDWNLTTGDTFFSARWKSMLGYADHEVASRYQTWVDLIHPEDRERVTRQLAEHLAHPGPPWEIEQRLRQKDGTYRWVLAKGKVLTNASGIPVRMAGSSSDIQLAKESETSLRNALQEKSVLLKEIHHRVKNNLQIVSSLLLLQSAHSRSEDTIASLETMRTRIHSMALLHETLYQKDNVTLIALPAYLDQLVSHILNSIGPAANRIQMVVKADPAELDLDTTVSLGLMVNEILTNSIKHAFPGERMGLISVVLNKPDDGDFCLVVKDDGVGLPQGIDPEELPSLGLKLIQMMSKKLRARVEISTDGGTEYRFEFAAPDPHR